MRLTNRKTHYTERIPLLSIRSIRTNQHIAYTDRYGAGVLDNPRFVMAAKKSRTFSTLLMQRSKLGALSKSQNWSAGSWPNQSFCQRNKLYPRDFAGKAFPSCIPFRILLIWLDSFDLKRNFQYDVS